MQKWYTDGVLRTTREVEGKGVVMPECCVQDQDLARPNCKELVNQAEEMKETENVMLI